MQGFAVVRRGCCAGLLSLCIVVIWQRGASGTPLDDYVQAPDGSYSFSVLSSTSGPGYTEYLLGMDSQVWRSTSEVDRTLWQHALFVIVPDGASGPVSLLRISGGSHTGSPVAQSFEHDWAVSTGTVVASLRWVPYQPLRFAGESTRRWEDAIIAYTFAAYLVTGDSTWPLLLPMVKSTVRAMDTVQTFVSDVTGNDVFVEKFVLTGESKRGWTTWLTAAVDSRVEAIMPVVIDVLNIDEQMRHHRLAYEGVTTQTVGGYAVAVQDYVNAGAMQKLWTPAGQALVGIVDPYEYRDRFLLPKFLVNASGDEFFVPDSAQFYFHDLPGPKYLRYVPNAGHGGAASNSLGQMQAFYESILDGTPLPGFTWTVVDDATIRVETVDTPTEVRLWQTTNPTLRDFRISTLGPQWTSTVLVDQGAGVYLGALVAPPAGYTAFFVELEFPSGGSAPHIFTTEVACFCLEAAFTVEPSSGLAPLQVDLDSSPSRAPGDRQIVARNWALGDGTTADTESLSHEYPVPGRYPIALTVTDDSGLTSVARDQVSVYCESGDISPWSHQDVGTPAYPGAARLEGAGVDETLEVCAGGNTLGGVGDDGFLVSQEADGDVEVRARVDTILEGGSSSAVGVILRGHPGPGSPFAAVVIRPLGTGPDRKGRLWLQYRDGEGEASRGQMRQDPLDIASGWVRLQRRGETFTASSSLDGMEWFPVGTPQPLPELGGPLLGGLVATGGDIEYGTSRFEALQTSIAGLAIEPLPPETVFIRGNCNDDEVVDISDAVCTLEWLFLGGETPGCIASLNTNGDDAVDLSDAVYTLTFLFLGGPSPAEPFPDCGVGMLEADAETCDTVPESCSP